MTPTRYHILDTNPRVRLTRKERKHGWHYCPELDGALEALIPCTCQRPGFKKRLRRIEKAFARWDRKHRDTIKLLHDTLFY